MDSTNKTHLPRNSRAPASGTSVVGQIATDTKMICLYVLMVVATSCLDRAVQAISIAQASVSLSVEISRVTPASGRDKKDRLAEKQRLANRVDLVQFGGHATNLEDAHTDVRDRGGMARHARQHRLLTIAERTEWGAKLEESWRAATDGVGHSTRENSR